VAIASLDARLKSEDYAGAFVDFSAQTTAAQWRDVLTDVPMGTRNGSVELAETFSVLPVALLVPA
jgi:maltooligosyltrehalose synthase